MRASQRLRATPATRRSATSSGPSSCSRRSASKRAGTTTSPPYATTRGSRKLFAERAGLDPRRAEITSADLREVRQVTFPNTAHVAPLSPVGRGIGARFGDDPARGPDRASGERALEGGSVGRRTVGRQDVLDRPLEQR